MNWDAIGAIGEIIGAAGVILSLVYLAVQIRHASRTTQVQIEQSETASIVAQMLSMVENPDLGMELLPGSENIGDHLHLKKLAFWFSWFTNASFSHKHARTATQLDDVERRYGTYIGYWFRHDADFAGWWKSVSRNFPQEFVNWVNEHGQ